MPAEKFGRKEMLTGVLPPVTGRRRAGAFPLCAGPFFFCFSLKRRQTTRTRLDQKSGFVPLCSWRIEGSSAHDFHTRVLFFLEESVLEVVKAERAEGKHRNGRFLCD